jgi:hypothetical protein
MTGGMGGCTIQDAARRGSVLARKGVGAGVIVRPNPPAHGRGPRWIEKGGAWWHGSSKR